MPQMSISQVARQVGLRPSAIRYYEQIGILVPAQRSGGQRRYDSTVLYRLAVIQRARQIGFTLEEIRQLFFGFRKGTPASQRWKTMTKRKLAELEVLTERIQAMQSVLRRLQNCPCKALDQCGEGMLRNLCADSGLKTLPANPRRGR